MAFNATNPVSVADPTKKDHYDRVFDNTVALYAGEMALTSQAARDILFATSASQLSRLAAGTSGHFLQTLGAGSDPVWAQAGVLKFVGRTAAASGQIQVSFVPTLSKILVVWNEVETDTDAIDMYLRLNAQTSGYQYHVTDSRADSSGSADANDDTATFIKLNDGAAGLQLGNADGEQASGVAWVTKGGSDRVLVHGQGAYMNASGKSARPEFVGTIDLGGAISSVELVPSSGNFDAGELVVYELAEA